MADGAFALSAELSSIAGYAELLFFFSSRRRHTRCLSDWSSDVCSSDLNSQQALGLCREGEINVISILHQALKSLEDIDSKQTALAEAEQMLGSALIQVEERSEERRVGKECRTRWSE